MTDPLTVSGERDALDRGKSTEAFEMLLRGAVQLLAAPGPRPSRLAVQDGSASITLEWKASAAVPGAPAAVPGTVPVAAPVAVPAVVPAPSDPGAAAPGWGTAVCAPIVGVFYRAPRPGAPPFATVGDEVRAGQQVGIVEAMKMMIPVEADRAGRVVEVLVEDGATVEFGEPLLSLTAA